MGCCNCIRQEAELFPFDLQICEKSSDSTSTGLNSMKSSLQSTIRPPANLPFTIPRSPIPEAAQESEAMSLKLPDCASESSIASWKRNSSPFI